MHALVAIPSRWPRLRRLDRMVIVAVVATVVGVTYPRLPPGICFGDSGGLQLAALTLGITHPPGYPGYATVGYIASHIPGIDSVRAVTLGYWLSGIAAYSRARICALLGRSSLDLYSQCAAIPLLAIASISSVRI